MGQENTSNSRHLNCPQETLQLVWFQGSYFPVCYAALEEKSFHIICLSPPTFVCVYRKKKKVPHTHRDTQQHTHTTYIYQTQTLTHTDILYTYIPQHIHRPTPYTQTHRYTHHIHTHTTNTDMHIDTQGHTQSLCI